MCIQYIKLKSKSDYNIKQNWVPCGKCADCRKSMATSWTFRLNAEIDEYVIRQNYNCGFITLTYNEQHLPHLPKSLFQYSDKNYEKIPCFNYSDIKKFTDCIRGYLWREYKIKSGFRFFITSEYGEKYHRPHYHGILIWDNSISYDTMYKIVLDAWTGSNNLIPNNRKSKRLNLGIVAPFDTFVVNNKQACAKYVAKYVCKDIAFDTTIKGLNLTKLPKYMKNHLRHLSPFHKQSMAFGSVILKDKTEDDLLDMYKNGVSFVASNQKWAIPTYIKNKILFDNYKIYNLKTHKFETRKKYSWFMKKYSKEIYDKKISLYTKFYQEIANNSYWEIHKSENQLCDSARNTCRNLVNIATPATLAQFHTLYYGIPWTKCHWDDSPENLLLARYNPCADLENLPQLDYEYYHNMNDICNLINGYVHLNLKYDQSADEKLINEIRDYFQNLR